MCREGVHVNMCTSLLNLDSFFFCSIWSLSKNIQTVKFKKQWNIYIYRYIYMYIYIYIDTYTCIYIYMHPSKFIQCWTTYEQNTATQVTWPWTMAQKIGHTGGWLWPGKAAESGPLLGENTERTKTCHSIIMY